MPNALQHKPQMSACLFPSLCFAGAVEPVFGCIPVQNDSDIFGPVSFPVFSEHVSHDVNSDERKRYVEETYHRNQR